MSLSNLKKSTPSAKPRAISVEDFIDQALHYANGEPPVAHVITVPEKACAEPMRRATFTLSEVNRQKLTLLSHSRGISRSGLIRSWIDQAYDDFPAPGGRSNKKSRQ